MAQSEGHTPDPGAENNTDVVGTSQPAPDRLQPQAEQVSEVSRVPTDANSVHRPHPFCLEHISHFALNGSRIVALLTALAAVAALFGVPSLAIVITQGVSLSKASPLTDCAFVTALLALVLALGQLRWSAISLFRTLPASAPYTWRQWTHDRKLVFAGWALFCISLPFAMQLFVRFGLAGDALVLIAEAPWTASIVLYFHSEAISAIPDSPPRQRFRALPSELVFASVVVTTFIAAGGTAAVAASSPRAGLFGAPPPSSSTTTSSTSTTTSSGASTTTSVATKAGSSPPTATSPPPTSPPTTSPPPTSPPTTSCPWGPGEGAPALIARAMMLASAYGAATGYGCLQQMQVLPGGFYVQAFQNSTALLVGSQWGAGVVEPLIVAASNLSTGIPSSFTTMHAEPVDQLQCWGGTGVMQPYVGPRNWIVFLWIEPNFHTPPIEVPQVLIAAYSHEAREWGVLLVPVSPATKLSDGTTQQQFRVPDTHQLITLRSKQSGRPLSIRELWDDCQHHTPLPYRYRPPKDQGA